MTFAIVLIIIKSIKDQGVGDKIDIVEGDMTRLAGDAIVTDANNRLLGGGGVDGVIHRASGPELLEECRNLGGCDAGEAKITQGCCLPAKHVIHAVGSVWQGGERREPDLLRACYRNCLGLAREHGLISIAFPSISTGVYGYPFEETTRIALKETKMSLERETSLEQVLFVCYPPENAIPYRTLYAEIFS